MTRQVLKINDGPDKPALQKSLAYENKQVEFILNGNPFGAQIEHLEEQAEGMTFAIKGRITSGEFKGQSFQGMYSSGTRSGSLALGVGG
ncbi:MAG TPA: hypothetical protein PKE16_06670 [Hyphomicrobium sp.]|nr:hypothetical protein [Hyphomicrobium sp.]